MTVVDDTRQRPAVIVPRSDRKRPKGKGKTADGQMKLPVKLEPLGDRTPSSSKEGELWFTGDEGSTGQQLVGEESESVKKQKESVQEGSEVTVQIVPSDGRVESAVEQVREAKDEDDVEGRKEGVGVEGETVLECGREGHAEKNDVGQEWHEEETAAEQLKNPTHEAPAEEGKEGEVAAEVILPDLVAQILAAPEKQDE
jgi:hypothetical protein